MERNYITAMPKRMPLLYCFEDHPLAAAALWNIVRL
jgi:hypothetical protein